MLQGISERILYIRRNQKDFLFTLFMYIWNFERLGLLFSQPLFFFNNSSSSSSVKKSVFESKPIRLYSVIEGMLSLETEKQSHQ